jgi:endonuclease I
VVEEEAVETVEAAEVAEAEDLQAAEAVEDLQAAEAAEDLQAAEAAEAEEEEVFPLFNHSHRWEHQEDKREMLNQWDNSPPSSTETEPNRKDSLTY